MYIQWVVITMEIGWKPKEHILAHDKASIYVL